MATFYWQSFADRSYALGTSFDSKGDAAAVVAGGVLDNTSNLDPFMLFEIVLGSITPAANGYIEVYLQKSIDGTNYEQDPIIGGADRNTLLLTIPVDTAASIKRIMPPFVIPILPIKYKFWLGNQTGVTTAASGNSLNVRTGRLQT